MVGQVDSQSGPGTSFGVGKISLWQSHKCLRGLRPMGSNADLGKECVALHSVLSSNYK